MANFPDEITMIILSNLPVKSLLRFKCVSKPWRSWITSPNFQLSNQESRQGAITMMKYEEHTTRTSSFRYINQVQLTPEELIAPFMIRWDNAPYFVRDNECPESYKGKFRLLGSCNGLILISINNIIYLWNPATRYYNRAYELDDLEFNHDYTCGGLCFDSSKNVYKALMIMERRTSLDDDEEEEEEEGGNCAIVASFQDKKWRQVEFPNGDMRSICDGITLYGRIHFRVRDVSRDDTFNCIGLCNEIICFDPVIEKFDMFPVPEPKFDQVENVIVGLGALNECLCMTRLVQGKVEMLVMKEYGVKESWTSIFFIRNLEINPFYGAVVPLFMTDNGEFVSVINKLCEKNVVIYDPKNDNMQDIQLVDGRKEYISYHICYVESLISPQELLLE